MGRAVDEAVAEVGGRIRESMPDGLKQRALAERVGMAPDALSRALNGLRGFAPIELAAIAVELDVDLVWLLTGRPDPHRMTLAARHAWDPARQERANPGENEDQAELDRIREMYRGAYPDGPPPSGDVPDVSGLRQVLGDDFVPRFADAVEARWGVDVVRVPGLGTDYSLRVGRRAVIVLRTGQYWFRSNWSLAHELGHLALGHHEQADGNASAEEGANRFAENLMLPRDVLRAQDWQRIGAAELAGLVWRWGVSTQALRARLMYVKVPVADDVRELLELSTPRLLRAHGTAFGGAEAVSDRQQRAAGRRFPTALLAALTARVESGTARPGPLAWALDVPLDDLDFPEPDDPAPLPTDVPSLALLRGSF